LFEHREGLISTEEATKRSWLLNQYGAGARSQSRKRAATKASRTAIAAEVTPAHMIAGLWITGCTSILNERSLHRMARQAKYGGIQNAIVACLKDDFGENFDVFTWLAQLMAMSHERLSETMSAWDQTWLASPAPTSTLSYMEVMREYGPDVAPAAPQPPFKPYLAPDGAWVVLEAHPDDG